MAGEPLATLPDKQVIKPLWNHQAAVIPRATLLHTFAFLWEMGTGKTRAVIETLKGIFNSRGQLQRTIIFCPPLVIPNWRDEWLMYTRIQPRKVVPLYGPGKKRLKLFLKNAYDETTGFPIPCIFITNYEAMLMGELYDAMLEWEAEVLVFDESHKCKSPNTSRSKQAYNLANPYDYRLKKRKPKPRTIILTGTLTLNSPLDVFQQYKILDGGETFGQNFFVFRLRYFVDRNAGIPKDRYYPLWEVKNLERDGVDSVGELRKLIYSKADRVTKEQCLDLPPEVMVPIKVGMSPIQTRLYTEMKKDFLTYYKSKACVATLAITKALRLMQITSGYVSAGEPGDNEGPVEHMLDDVPKRDALKQLLEECVKENGHKTLVWAVFRHNYKLIREVCDELKISYVEIHGEISDKQKRANVDSFKADKGVQVLIGHPGSGGIGINLTVAPISIFYSRTFSLEHYMQARSRNHRGGATEAGHLSITHYDLVCENTIDEIAVKKLANKQDLSETLLDELAQELTNLGE